MIMLELLKLQQTQEVMHCLDMQSSSCRDLSFSRIHAFCQLLPPHVDGFCSVFSAFTVPVFLKAAASIGTGTSHERLLADLATWCLLQRGPEGGRAAERQAAQDRTETSKGS